MASASPGRYVQTGRRCEPCPLPLLTQYCSLLLLGVSITTTAPARAAHIRDNKLSAFAIAALD